MQGISRGPSAGPSKSLPSTCGILGAHKITKSRTKEPGPRLAHVHHGKPHPILLFRRCPAVCWANIIVLAPSVAFSCFYYDKLRFFGFCLGKALSFTFLSLPLPQMSWNKSVLYAYVCACAYI